MTSWLLTLSPTLLASGCSWEVKNNENVKLLALEVVVAIYKLEVLNIPVI